MRREPERLCLSCGKTITVGRSDKRYCDDICRARDTRKRNREGLLQGYEESHKAIIQAIKRNYNLLKKAMDQREEWIVDFAVLYEKGFDQNIYTSTDKTENDQIRYYCFEIGWVDIGEARLQVRINLEKLNVHRQEDMEQNLFIPYSEPEDEV